MGSLLLDSAWQSPEVAADVQNRVQGRPPPWAIAFVIPWPDRTWPDLDRQIRVRDRRNFFEVVSTHQNTIPLRFAFGKSKSSGARRHLTKRSEVVMAYSWPGLSDLGNPRVTNFFTTRRSVGSKWQLDFGLCTNRV